MITVNIVGMSKGKKIICSQCTECVMLLADYRYVHDGSEKTEDKFFLMVSDGFNQVRRTVTIDVRLVNDHIPKPLSNLRTDIVVGEGQEVVITSANLAATDNDTDDQLLTFILIRYKSLFPFVVDLRARVSLPKP